MKKTLIFDNFLSETNRDTIDVTVYGKVYTIPAMIPAIVPLTLARAEAGDNGEMSDNETARMILRSADAIFGRKAVDEIVSNGMSLEDLALLIGKVFAMIQGTDSDEEETGESFDDNTNKKTVKKAPKR